MPEWPHQLRRKPGLAAALLSVLLVETAFGFPLRQLHAADLNPLKLYRDLDSLAGVALARGRHFVNDLETLYKIYHLTPAASQAGKSSVPNRSSSPPASSAQEPVCQKNPGSSDVVPSLTGAD